VAHDDETIGRRAFLAGLIAAMGGSLASPLAFADRKRRGSDDDDDDDNDDDDPDHEAARRARAAGEIAPLTQIIEHVRKKHAGEIVGIELDREAGRWVYEVKLITPRNRYLEIYVDARGGDILKVEGE